MNPFERWDDWEWERAAQEIGRDHEPFGQRDFQRNRTSYFEKRPTKDILEILNGSQKRVILSALLFLTIIFSSRGEDAVSQGVYAFYKTGIESGNLYTSLNTMAKEAIGIPGAEGLAVNTQMEGIFYPPVAGALKVGFGKEHEGQISRGIEIASSLGTPVLCPEEGVVLEVSKDPRLGNFIRINFGNGWEGIVGNLGEVTVSQGDPVSMGLKLGTVGLKPESQNPWVYLELMKDGKPMNPLQYLIQNK